VNRTKSLIVVGLLFLAFAVPAIAFECNQGGPTGTGFEGAEGGHGHHRGGCRSGGGFYALASRLDLSKEQTDRLHELRSKQISETGPMRNEMLQKRLEMRKIFTDPTKDEATILAKQREIQVIQQKLHEKMTQFRLEQRRVLTPEQLKRLNETTMKPGLGRCWG
jgi:Spy/CpxP family protein refolding chaperone